MFDIFYTGTKPNRFPHECEVASFEQAKQLSRTRYFWWITYLADLDTVDFLWEPTPWESNQRHAWASQWQQDAGIYLVPKNWDGADTNYHKEIVKRKSGIPVVEIDHLDGNSGKIADTFKTVRYFDNYKDVLTRIAKSIQGQHEYVWICSSICNYSNFDFSWHPDPWQTKLLHVFPSNNQKFGDTFLMHVDSFAQRIAEFDLLDWYDLNFVDISVPRQSMPVIKHTDDTHIDQIKNKEFAGPVALFTNDGIPFSLPAVPLWREQTKTIVPLSKGASCVVVPKTAVPYLKTQLYDYPYIDKTYKNQHKDDPLDIVFISNGEPNAEKNYQHLVKITKANMNSSLNSIRRISNINGRVAAYHAAAKASTTPWFFAVFAKLEVNPSFDWTWQPDRLQQPKHYIFHARNPVNGLEYGHQAMIAYNRQLVLSNPGRGLDFTLDDAHEVVPVLSGTAEYHHSPWMCWRTSFREVLKLKANLPDVESEYRIKQWLKKNYKDDYVKWSHIGAEDAVEFYESVAGDPKELKKSYDWQWLSSFAFIQHGLTPYQ